MYIAQCTRIEILAMKKGRQDKSDMNAFGHNAASQLAYLVLV